MLRILRWCDRIQALYSGDFPTMWDHDLLQDFAHAFFVECLSLRDWLINDPSVTVQRAAIHKFVNNDSSLGVCRDLANGAKHLTLDRLRRTDDARVSHREVQWRISPQASPAPSYRITLAWKELNDEAVRSADLLEFAWQCVRAWDRYLDLLEIAGHERDAIRSGGTGAPAPQPAAAPPEAAP